MRLAEFRSPASGCGARELGPAAAGAAVAGAIVLAAGLAVHRPLTRVPENGLKFAVGLMLTTFGVFWSGEGIGVDWPAGDATLVPILAVFLAASVTGVWLLRARVSSHTGIRARWD